MLAAVTLGTSVIATCGVVIATLLQLAASKLRRDNDSLTNQINQLLPQTQCAQCGYPGCRPYAEAIARGESINRCPPGGEETIRELAELLGRPEIPLDPNCGDARPGIRAIIREAECIGCTLCIQACPVDAIVGAPQWMHTVIEAECTGCKLCVEPCPVDCIDLVQPLMDSHEAIPTTPAPHMECIRCGECEDVCPKDLLPQSLYWYREDNQALEALDLDHCIECRQCDRACPSDIPLTTHFQAARSRIAARQNREAQAHHAEKRYLARELRITSHRDQIRQRPTSNEKQALLDQIKKQIS